MKKYVLIIGALAVMLMIAAGLHVRSNEFSDRIRPYVTGPVREILGDDAVIGRIRANLFPLYIEVRDVSLPDASGRPAVSLRAVRIYVNPLPLLFKKVRLPSIVLREPKIELEHTGEGKLNLTPLIERIKANGERMSARGSSGYTVLLKTISVSKGSITLKDHPSSVQATVNGLQAAVKVNLDGDTYALTVKKADLAVSAPAIPLLSGQLRGTARYERHRLDLESLEVRTGDTSMTLAGSVDPLPDPVLDLRLKVKSGPQTIGKFTNLIRRLKKEQRSFLQASASLQGTLSAPVMEGSVQLDGISYEDFVLRNSSLSFDYRSRSLSLQGHKWKVLRGADSIMVDSIDAAISSSERGIDIGRFSVQAGDLSVLISGRADPKRGFDAVVQAESRGKGQSLSFLTSVPVEGSVNVKGYLTGVLNAPLLDGTFSAGPLTVKGILFDAAGGSIQYRENRFSLVSVDIHQQKSRYLFSGSVDLAPKEPVMTARLKVLRSDVRSIVALFYRPLPLYFSANGDLSFSGTPRDFSGTGRLVLEPGSAYGEKFTKAVITASLTSDRISFTDVRIEKGAGSVTGTGWIAFDGTYGASIESRGVRFPEVDLIAGVPVEGSFDLFIESGGSFREPWVTASLDADAVSLNEMKLGALAAELLIRDKVLTGSVDIAGDRARMTGSLALVRPYAWSTELALSPELFDPFLLLGKKDLAGSVKAAVQGKLALRGVGLDQARLAGDASIQELAFILGDYVLDSDGPVSASLRGDRISIGSLEISGQGTSLSVTGGARFRKEIDLSFLGTAHLSLLKPLLHDLEYSDGTAQVVLGIKGEWSGPDMAGEILLRNGELKLRDLPQKFSALSGKISFDQSRIVLDVLTGEMGGGTLRATGNTQLSGLALLDFSTKVNFENVTVRYPEGLAATLSGDMRYDGDASERFLSGDIAIQRARYDKRVEWKSMLVDIGKGLYQKKKSEAGWIGTTQINVRFFGKDNIVFQNNLAKMPLEVDVFLRGTVNRPQLLGRIEARKGSVYFRQNEFMILHGSADFVDPNRINPVLDIQAETQIRQYLVRLGVSGTAERAIVTLLSDPQLSDPDILALLALGKTSDQLKGRETSVGMSEAASLATGQFQDVFESRARSLTGLDRFQVDPYVSKGDTSVPRVTVGKEVVQNKLYVTYSSNVGATTPEQIFRIEYLLNKHFSLVGERNELGNTGADIKYRFEFK